MEAIGRQRSPVLAWVDCRDFVLHNVLDSDLNGPQDVCYCKESNTVKGLETRRYTYRI